MTEITYTQGQEAGSVLFGQFYLAPYENVMVLKGFSGTGKSTLVRRLIGEVAKLDDMCRMLHPSYRPYEVVLTATTNQAAESLAASIGFKQEVGTIHSFLGLRVHTVDYVKKIKELRASRKEKRERYLIFIDECSYIDSKLMKLILQETSDCKIVFIGDHAQLKPVGASYMPAFEMNKNQIELTELVRFDDGPISNMVSALRKTVLEGIWPNFSDFIAPGVIEKVDRARFDQLTMDAFQPGNPMGRSKILAYTNDCVIGYNNRLSAALSGSSDPQPGQIMVNNEECRRGNARVANNIEVQIQDVEEGQQYGYKGWWVKLQSGEFFMPENCRTTRNQAHQEAVRNDDYEMMRAVVDEWIDLRPAYACTGNKSQGSTYDTSFIDLGNIVRMVRGGDALARLLYVVCSRAKSRMYFTGDVGG
jgi:hypothetical protein